MEAGPVGEEELDMIKMFCYNSAAEFCNKLNYTKTYIFLNSEKQISLRKFG